MLTGRSWRWFTVRLYGLPATSRLWSTLRERHGDRGDDSIESVDEALGVRRE